MDATQRPAQLCERVLARARVSVERQERPVGDERAHDCAPFLIHVDDPRGEASVRGELLDVKLAAPAGERLARSRDLQYERLSAGIDAVDASTGEPRSDAADRGGRSAEVGGQARVKVHDRIEVAEISRLTPAASCHPG